MRERKTRNIEKDPGGERIEIEYWRATFLNLCEVNVLGIISTKRDSKTKWRELV